jgi:hypothetical protein
MLSFFILGLLLWGKLKIVGQPTEEEENAWRHWIQENLNEGKNNPKESQYSLMCVVGWSRFNIVLFVVFPFCFTAFASIIFGIVWSQDIRSHKGDVPGAWAISTFIITLAAGMCLFKSRNQLLTFLNSYFGFDWDHWRSRILTKKTLLPSNKSRISGTSFRHYPVVNLRDVLR